MKSWLHSIGFDRAIAYSLLLKSWQVIVGLVGIVLIAGYFPLEVQGFYYTIASLIALQSFVELGLYLVIYNCASHEWSELHLGWNGRIEGNPDALSRLVSLGRFTFKWYAAAALIYLILAGGGGYWFLERTPAPHIDWRMPWLVHVVFSSILLWCTPFLSLLEGCDQVARVARFRTWQAIGSNLALWAAILSGTGLWAAPALSITSVLVCVGYLLVGRREFFKPFFRPPESARICWRSEVFPMQWRLAMQGVMNYFVYSLFTPVMFYYHGPAAAGKMGMTWQVVMAIQSVAIIWVATKAPRFGMLVAKREFAALDMMWRKAALMSFSGLVCGVIIIFLLMDYLTGIHWDPINRMVTPSSFLMLAGGAVFADAVECLAIYLRAHKREALTPVAIVTGILMAMTVWQFGATYGAAGVSASYLVVMSTVAFPFALLVWRKACQDWHR